MLTRRSVLQLAGAAAGTNIPLQGQSISSNGDVDWSVGVGSDILYGPSLSETYVYSSLDGGEVVQVHQHSGNYRTFELESTPTGSPIVVDGYVFVADVDGNLYCLSTGSLQIEWQQEFEDEFDSNLVVMDETLFIGTVEGDVRSFDAASGQPLWTAETQGEGRSKILPYGEELIFTISGDVVSIGRESGEVWWSFSTDDEEQFVGIPTPLEHDLAIPTESGKLASARYSELNSNQSVQSLSYVSVENPQYDWEQRPNIDEPQEDDGYGGFDDDEYEISNPNAEIDSGYTDVTVATNTEDGHVQGYSENDLSRRFHFDDADDEIPPVISDGVIFYPADGELIAFDYMDEFQDYHVDANVTTPMTISSQYIYFGSGSSLVKAHISRSGEGGTLSWFGITGHSVEWAYDEQVIDLSSEPEQDEETNHEINRERGDLRDDTTSSSESNSDDSSPETNSGESSSDSQSGESSSDTQSSESSDQSSSGDESSESEGNGVDSPSFDNEEFSADPYNPSIPIVGTVTETMVTGGKVGVTMIAGGAATVGTGFALKQMEDDEIE